MFDIPGPAIRPPDKPPMFCCEHCKRPVHYVKEDKCPFCGKDVSGQIAKYKEMHKNG